VLLPVLRVYDERAPRAPRIELDERAPGAPRASRAPSDSQVGLGEGPEGL
jgi:hypothetical protein